MTTTKPNSQPLIYRINDAIKQMEISRVTLYRLVKSGDLELIKISVRASGITSASINKHLNRNN